MQYLDELLALYVGRDPATQKYLLTSLAAVPTGFDTESVLDLLWSEAVSNEPIIANQARRELGHLLPAYLKLDYGLAEQEAGVWTQAHHRGDPEKFKLRMKLALLTDEDIAPKVVAGLQLFAPFQGRIFRCLDARHPRLKAAASMLTGRLQLKSTTEQLIRRVSTGAPPIADTVALAELGDDEARRALVKLANDQGKDHPDVIMALGQVPGEETFGVLDRLEREGDTYARANVAQALHNATTQNGRELLERLIRRREGWVTAYALDALVGSPKPDDLALVQLAYASESHEFIRVLVVKTAGYIVSPNATQFLLDRIADGTPRIQAAALEGLTRQKCELSVLAQQAVKLVGSPLLRARVNALLILAGVDPARVAPFIRQLLVSEQNVSRLEGAFILGYIASEEGSAVLTEMAANDPSYPVQAQAIKSLRKQPSLIAMPRLLSLIKAPDPKVAMLATRALSTLEVGDPAPVEEALKKLMTSGVPTPVRAGLLKALGMFAARRGVNAAPDFLVDALTDPEPSVVLGAIEGLKMIGDHGAPKQLKPLLEAADPRIRVRAILATVMAGEVDALRALEELLASVMQEQVLAAFSGLLELAVVLPAALRSERFLKLATSLDALTREKGYAAFVTKERVAGGLITAVKTVRVNPELPAMPQAAGIDSNSSNAVPRDAQNILKEQYSSPHNRLLSPTQRRLDSRKVAQAGMLGDVPSAPSARSLTWKHLLGLALLPPLVTGSFVLYQKMNPPPEAPPVDLSVPVGANRASVAPIPMHGMRTYAAGGSPVRRTESGDKPLSVGDVIEPGDLIISGAGSSVVIQDEKNDSVVLGANSQVKVLNSGGKTGIARFESAEGDVYIAYAKAKSVELKYAHLKITCGAGSFRVYKDALGLHLVSISGDIRMEPPGRLVPSGETFDLR